MSKILSTIVLTVGLLFGGIAVMAPPAAMAVDCNDPVGCATPPCGNSPLDPPCPAPPCNPNAPDGECSVWSQVDALSAKLVTAEQTANDYRQQVVALTAKVAQQQRQLDRQARRLERKAATIKRLRAKIRRLR